MTSDARVTGSAHRAAGHPLRAAGWDDGWQNVAAAHRRDAGAPSSLDLGRVLRVDRSSATVMRHDGPVEAAWGPGVRRAARDDPGATPATGDWVLLEFAGPGRPVVADVLPRRTSVRRLQVGGSSHAQVLVANVALGVGSWQLRFGGQAWTYELAVSGRGFGEEILTPPVQTSQVELVGEDVVEASVALRLRSGAENDGTADEPMAGVGLFGLVARTAPRDQDAAIAAAVQAATSADVAVVVVGLTEEQETEAVDKATVHLPGAQDALVSAVAAAARRTVVVVNAATPVIMPWLQEVDAVLWAGLPGQEGGHAVAAVLLGDLEPAGRLVTTFPVEDGAAPAWSVTPVAGAVSYDEGTFIGYRGHDAGRAPAPAFWLRHGLGYSTWDYTDPQLRPGAAAPSVSVTVTNTGTRDSREVVQLYWRPSALDQPVRLVGWRAVTAAAGQSTTVEVYADARMWRRWSTSENAWDVLPMDGQLLLARGLGDVRATIDLPR